MCLLNSNLMKVTMLYRVGMTYFCVFGASVTAETTPASHLVYPSFILSFFPARSELTSIKWKARYVSLMRSLMTISLLDRMRVHGTYMRGLHVHGAQIEIFLDVSPS